MAEQQFLLDALWFVNLDLGDYLALKQTNPIALAKPQQPEGAITKCAKRDRPCQTSTI